MNILNMLTIIIIVVLSLILIKMKKQKSNIEEEKNNKKTYEEKQLKGEEYERRVGEEYEKEGYIIEYRGINKNLNDFGIDLIAIKENETLLIQCKNWTNESKYKIREKEVKEFYGACNFYLEENNLTKENILCIYAIPDKKIINQKAMSIFKKHFKNCRYKEIK